VSEAWAWAAGRKAQLIGAIELCGVPGLPAGEKVDIDCPKYFHGRGVRVELPHGWAESSSVARAALQVGSAALAGVGNATLELETKRHCMSDLRLETTNACYRCHQCLSLSQGVLQGTTRRQNGHDHLNNEPPVLF